MIYHINKLKEKNYEISTAPQRSFAKKTASTPNQLFNKLDIEWYFCNLIREINEKNAGIYDKIIHKDSQRNNKTKWKSYLIIKD